ncbi:threonine dehydratase [Ramlibacter sp. H39-3-26]|uniref:threonine dehydratase n=1 Tax=Curvibacter soli TaxID=3031331 RepID=UPI0023DA45F5|nr:threonine dehydratase [Ramlibacter sp. H39-3-26]MDF1485817.1 threonine dehydratase [Ramlibacter sp. H39-3-26]
MQFTRDEIADAQRTVYAALPPTPQYAWPLLGQALGATAWVKHENHTPVGAFKIRGGLTYFAGLARTQPAVRHVVSATRGNHGQSVGFAARRHGLAATIVVPHGNSTEKNAAMRALGVRLVEHGDDFQAASEHAARLAEHEGLHRIPSFHRDLVRGVATAYVELFESLQRQGEAPLDVLYVPIGLGSGFAGAAAARAHCGVATRLVGVVSAHATAYLDSWRAGRALDAPVSTRLADGMACRTPVPESLEVLRREADDVVAVTDAEVAAAMRLLYTATHNVAEGAGAAALAAAMQQRGRWQGRRVGVALTGGNVDAATMAGVLAGGAAADAEPAVCMPA